VRRTFQTVSLGSLVNKRAATIHPHTYELRERTKQVSEKNLLGISVDSGEPPSRAKKRLFGRKVSSKRLMRVCC
jgi:hypothetical protein